MNWNRRVIASAAVVVALALSSVAEAGRRDRLIAGPIIGGMAANNGYYAYGPYYWPGSAVGWSPLYGPAAPVAPGCYMQRQRLWTEYGWRWRTAPICY